MLSVNDPNALASTTAISFGGGTLQFTANNTHDYSNIFSNAPSQPISIDTNGQSVTFASALTSSGGSLTKLGAGTLALTNAGNSFDGGLFVQNGTLLTATVNNAGSNGPLGTTSVTMGSSTITAIGTLEYTGSSATSTMPFTINSNIIGIGGGTFQIDNAATNLTLTGLISGGASGQPTSLTKTGPGTLTLNNSNNSYFGTTTISQGHTGHR